MAANRVIQWSPQGWLLVNPVDKSTSEPQRSLTFSEISYAVMETAKEADKIFEEMTDAIEKNKMETHKKLLKSSAAQFIAAGQTYNADPTPQNEQKMKDAETVVGVQHKKTLELIRLHSENRFNVDPGHQRQYLIKEMEKAMELLQEWKGQIELMQIDADTFYTAADRLVRAYTSIIKTVLTGVGRDTQIEVAKQVQAWIVECQHYRDIFLPREAKKWLQVNAHAKETQVFKDLDQIHNKINGLLRQH